MVAETLKAADMLAEEGIDARVINIHTIKPIDEEILIKASKETGAIVTAEEHYIMGGLGSAVTEVICANAPCPVKIIGTDRFENRASRPYCLRNTDLRLKISLRTQKNQSHSSAVDSGQAHGYRSE